MSSDWVLCTKALWQTCDLTQFGSQDFSGHTCVFSSAVLCMQGEGLWAGAEQDRVMVVNRFPGDGPGAFVSQRS